LFSGNRILEWVYYWMQTDMYHMHASTGCHTELIVLRQHVEIAKRLRDLLEVLAVRPCFAADFEVPGQGILEELLVLRVGLGLQALVLV